MNRSQSLTNGKSPSRGFGPPSGGRNRSASRNSRTPAKTPGKTQAKSVRNLTPSRNSNAVAINSRQAGGDRFIPNRSASNQDLSAYLIKDQSANSSISAKSTSCPNSPNRLEYQRIMSESLNGGVTGGATRENEELNNTAANFRVLAYQRGEAPVAPGGHANVNKVIYSARAAPASSCKKTSRHIPQTPEKILDAPEILDDYYLNLIDWSSADIMAVALSGFVYLWNHVTGEIQQLVELENSSDAVTSVKFSPSGGNYLAVGLSDGTAQLWDVQSGKKLRNLQGHSARVGALSWNSHVLSSGDGSGLIHNDDVRIPVSLINELSGHSQQICGLAWSPDGKYLASGGNDNLLLIWPSGTNEYHSQITPAHTLTDHQAAVKALAWCPWQPSILASGGGTADRHIRLWNVNTGQCLKAVDTESQVCGLIWSAEYKELISGHGYPGNQLSIWKYPKMTKVTDLTGHGSRVLYMAMSPCQEFVVSAAADESLRIWHCFAVDPQKKKKMEQEEAKKAPQKLLASIR